MQIVRDTQYPMLLNLQGHPIEHNTELRAVNVLAKKFSISFTPYQTHIINEW